MQECMVEWSKVQAVHVAERVCVTLFSLLVREILSRGPCGTSHSSNKEKQRCVLSRLVNLSTLDIWGGLILLRGCAVHCRMFSRFPDLCPLDASSTSSSLPVFFFLNFWLRWVFVAARGLSIVTARVGVQASVVVARGLSSCGSWAPERRLSSRGSRA